MCVGAGTEQARRWQEQEPLVKFGFCGKVLQDQSEANLELYVPLLPHRYGSTDAKKQTSDLDFI